MGNQINGWKAELPSSPSPRWGVPDYVLSIGSIIILYVGGVAAAGGTVAGMVLVVFGAFAVVTLRTSLLGRRNAPRVPRWTRYGAVVVASFAVVWSWNLFRDPSDETAWRFGMPAIPVVLLLVLLIGLFTPRRKHA